MKRYCIFGGTFNPPHIAHSILAQEVIEKLNLDKVIFIPAGNHALKKSIASFHRLKMAELAFAGNEYFEVSDIEVNSKEEISYSVDTLNLLNEKYKPENVKLYFLIGSDNLADLSRWKQPHKLFELSEVVVVVRPEYKYDDTPDEYRSKSVYIKAPLLEISSSEIRKKVAEGKSIRYYVHPEVEKYIYENNLYKKINN